jgi:hypothetical protein
LVAFVEQTDVRAALQKLRAFGGFQGHRQRHHKLQMPRLQIVDDVLGGGDRAAS